MVAVFVAMSGRLCHAAADAFPVVQTYSAEQVGAEVAVWTGLQDRSGVLYFGSNSLLRFDGDRWRSFPINDSFAIRALDLDAKNRLWAGAMGEFGWFSEVNGNWTFHSLRHELAADEPEIGNVWHAFAHGDGAVFAADNHLLWWDGRSLRSWRYSDGRRIRAFRTGEQIYFQHTLTGLYALRAQAPELIASSDVIGTAGIYWLERTPDGLFLIKNDGFFRLEGGECRPIPAEASTFLAKHPPTRIIALDGDRLAIGTTDGGILIVDRAGRVISTLNPEQGFNATSAFPLFLARDGELWTGTMAAIARVALTSKSTVLDHRAAFPAQPAIKIDRVDGHLLVGGMQGLFRLDEASRRFLPVSGAGEYYVTDFFSRDGALFVSGHRGVLRVRPDSVESVYATPQDVLLLAVARRRPNTFFAADNRSVVEVSPGETRVRAADLPDSADSIAEDSRGELWIGTRGFGLFRAPNEGTSAAIRAGEADGLPNPRAPAFVATLADGMVVAFNPLGGWARNERTGKFERIERTPRQVVTASALDPASGGLWLIHPAMGNRPPVIARIAREGHRLTWQPHSVDHLLTVGVPRSLFAETSGGVTTLWLGGTQGVLHHEIRGALSAPPPLAPLIRATARVHGDRTRPVAAEPLPAATRAVNFEFAIPDFGRRASLRLETRIDGVDDDWVPAAPGSHRELTSIRDGHYRVRARTVAETGASSGEAVLRFSVLQPWWRTTRGMSGLGLGVALLGYGAYQLRVRTLRRRNAELERKVRERTEELEQASAAKTQFVANMSHDIRNPLNGIVGLALALEDTRLDPRQRELVSTLRECTTYLSTLVDDVLDFASIEAGKVELRPGRFVPAELLQSVVTTLKNETAERGARLTVSIDPSLPAHLVGDAGRIQQILINYVSNALKYAGGHVRLTVALPATSPGEVEFAVSDEGPGITAEEQATLFTKFTRTSGARRDEIPGTGLGLAACRMLADLMGGSVGVTSTPQCGARFTLRLPLSIATEPAEIPVTSLPNTTVLLVEDTDYNAWAAAAVLSKLGLACERASTGAEALRLFGEKRFNVVLLDRNLPDMDGTEVARQMRQMEADGPPAVLLAVTAYCTAEDRSVCLEAGMDAFVGKPLTPDKLRRVLIAAGRRLLAAASVQISPDVQPAAEPALDMSLLNYLADDAAGLDNQIERFVATLTETEQELTQAQAAKDYEVVGTAAHRLLGQAKMIGGTTLASVASRLEDAARSRDFPACRLIMHLLAMEIQSLTEALRHRRSEAQPA